MGIHNKENQKWQMLRESVERCGFRRILKRWYRLPDEREVLFDLKLEPECVAIVALTPENEVILAQQFRPGPNKLLNEIPGGGIEEGESPEQAAARELLEETGYRGKLQFVTSSVDCAYSTLTRFNFVATDCIKVCEPDPDENEFVQVCTLPLDQFRVLLRSGQLSDVETGYLGLDFLGLL